MGNTFDKKIAWESDPQAPRNQRRDKLKNYQNDKREKINTRTDKFYEENKKE